MKTPPLLIKTRGKASEDMRNHQKAGRGAEDAETARVFFALWPGADISHALAAQARYFQQQVGGRQMRQETLHMTLLFIGAVPRVRLPALAAAVEGLEIPCTTLRLERFSIWRHNRIGYAAPVNQLPEIASVVIALRERLANAGFAWDRKPFVPHVTLLRNVERGGADKAMPAICWEVSSMALVESRLSDRGAQYLPLYRWPCSGQD